MCSAITSGRTSTSSRFRQERTCGSLYRDSASPSLWSVSAMRQPAFAGQPANVNDTVPPKAVERRSTLASRRLDLRHRSRRVLDLFGYADDLPLSAAAVRPFLTPARNKGTSSIKESRHDSDSQTTDSTDGLFRPGAACSGNSADGNGTP